ncbi:MAG: DUF547 domain-containing protein [Pseudomonadota bacterium]
MTALRLACAALMLILAGCTTLVRAPAAAESVHEPRESWARVLARFVDDQGRVDFTALAADRADLDVYVAWVYRVSPTTHPAQFPDKDTVLAYHLNAYNALAMYSVIEAGVPQTLAGLRKIPFFFLRQIQVGGQVMSLSNYEKQVIIPLGDVRVHFALNCMSVGCPRLPRQPFLATNLDAQLNREAQAFFADSNHLQVDGARKIVNVSEILKFYREDFLKAEPTLTDFINRYHAPAIPQSWQVNFIPYDWTINHQPRP